MLTGLYVPGNSWLHRLPPLVKMALLLVVTTAIMFWVNPWFYLGLTLGLILLFAATGLGVRNLWAQIWLLRWFMLLFIPLQIWQNGGYGLIRYVWSILIAIGVASAVTLSTRTNDMLEAVSRFLPEKVGLAMALTIRQIPVMMGMYGQVNEARVARGHGRSLRALAGPMLTRTLRHAQQVGEALAARGVDD